MDCRTAGESAPLQGGRQVPASAKVNMQRQNDAEKESCNQVQICTKFAQRFVSGIEHDRHSEDQDPLDAKQQTCLIPLSAQLPSFRYMTGKQAAEQQHVSKACRAVRHQQSLLKGMLRRTKRSFDHYELIHEKPGSTADDQQQGEPIDGPLLPRIESVSFKLQAILPTSRQAADNVPDSGTTAFRILPVAA